MGRRWPWVAGLALCAVAVIVACGKGPEAIGSSDSTATGARADAGGASLDAGAPDAGSGDAAVPDAGNPDAGSGYDTDAGTPDAGTPDAGTDAGSPDGGGTDGGGGGVVWTPPPPIAFPVVADWTFYGPQHGGPHDVYQVTADEGGNIWVAGGEDGLFLLQPGATTFQRFTMDDGLRPYGYLPDGSDPIGPKFLKVISVAGGPAGTVYAGYEGLPGCDTAWDTAANRPTPTNPGLAYVYKSGDADKVTLTATGLQVTHYDVFSGPGLVHTEMEGREKLCRIVRIVYDGRSGNLWFGGNHGFAWGDPNHTVAPACNGDPSCSGLVEHAHPAFNGCSGELPCSWVWVTDDYRGIAVAPDGDVWFGGSSRTTKFHWSAFRGSPRSRFMSAATLTQDGTVGSGETCPNNAYPCYIKNRIDVWRDLKDETGPGEIPPLKSERVPQDNVSGIAAMPDGSVYVGGIPGLRRLDPFGQLISDETSRLKFAKVGAVARDPIDDTVWIGNYDLGGLSRLHGAATDVYAVNVFGSKLVNQSVEDIQFDRGGATRRVLVAFRGRFAKDGTLIAPGFVAVYSGN